MLRDPARRSRLRRSIISDMAGKRPSKAIPIGSTELAYQRIRQAIIDGSYQPGQRLIEQSISEEFDLSRTPIRESLRRLEAEGLVLIEHNRGAIVRPVGETEIVDLYELRALLESLAAERSADRASPADLADLDEAISEFDAAMVPRPGLTDFDVLQEADAANYRFHNALYRISAHARLSHLMATAVDMPLAYQAMRVYTPELRARSNLFHQLIRDAVAMHDPARAGRLMTEHILMGRDAVLSHLKDQELPLAAALFEGMRQDDGLRSGRDLMSGT
jgi:DNA-binding GntR family transcriptional regulator